MEGRGSPIGPPATPNQDYGQEEGQLKDESMGYQPPTRSAGQEKHTMRPENGVTQHSASIIHKEVVEVSQNAKGSGNKSGDTTEAYQAWRHDVAPFLILNCACRRALDGPACRFPAAILKDYKGEGGKPKGPAGYGWCAAQRQIGKGPGWSKAVRSDMMLRQMVTEKSRFISVFQHLKPLLIEVTSRAFTPVDPVEDAELNWDILE
jgi:hypothetical protein